MRNKIKNLVPAGVANTFLPLKEENLFIAAKVAKNIWSQSVYTL